MSTYEAQSARDAEASGYGSQSYWDYLENHAHWLSGYFTAKGDLPKAREMMTQSLSESLMGNDGE